MSEKRDREPAGVDTKDDVVADVTGKEGAGRRNAEAAPRVGTDGEHGQTQVPAPDDDAGGAEDEESRTD